MTPVSADQEYEIRILKKVLYFLNWRRLIYIRLETRSIFAPIIELQCLDSQTLEFICANKCSPKSRSSLQSSNFVVQNDGDFGQTTSLRLVLKACKLQIFTKKLLALILRFQLEPRIRKDHSPLKALLHKFSSRIKFFSPFSLINFS